MSLIQELPKIRGKYQKNADLSKVNWFNIGGEAEVLFQPEDTEDLAFFLKNRPLDVPVTVIGVGSNLLVRDGGIDGVVIKLGKKFSNIEEVSTPDSNKKLADEKLISAGAGAVDVKVARFCAEHDIGGLEFLVGIPGTIGGALAMNAGAYGKEIKDVLVSAEAIDENGDIHNIPAEDFGFSYRKNSLPDSWVFTKAVLRGYAEESKKITEKMKEISEKREKTQPIKDRTSGSTFTNPDDAPNNVGGKKAWQLIDEAGCRGLKIGGAQVSEKHCNFFINTGNATASDMENLIEEVKLRVKKNSSVELKTEIRIVGKKDMSI